MSKHSSSRCRLLVILSALLVSSASALTVTFNSAADIPVTSAGYTASGTLTLVLNFAPSAGTALTVVKNTAITPISGTFTGLAHGGTISASYGGRSYSFIANYWGGTGNDLVLVWPDMGLAAWGGNTAGAIGDGSTTNRLAPVEVNASGMLAGKTVLATSSGYEHTLAVASDGKVYAWGGNGFGQLGDGTTTQRTTPVQVVSTGVLAGKTVVAIAAGASHSLALTTEGKVYAWGYDAYGQLGDGLGSNADRSSPIAVDMSGALAGKTVVGIAAGAHHSLALTADGLVFAWGDSVSGQVGQGDFGFAYASPNQVTSDDPAVTGKLSVAVSAGQFHSLALLADGTIAAWGRNVEGQLGDGTTTDRSRAVAIVQNGALAGKTITALSGGGWHSMALSADGKTFTWGYNGYGQFGNGTNNNSSLPLAVLQGYTVTSIAAGYLHSLVLTSPQDILGSGQGANGELGDGNVVTYSTLAVQVSASGVLANRRYLHLPTMPTARHSIVAASKSPEIKLEDNGFVPALPLSSGSSVPFPTLGLGQNVSRTFTVTNAGTLPLTGIVVTVDGAQSADYTLTQAPASTLAVGAATTFVIRFAPSASGLRVAAFHVSSSDPDQPVVHVNLDNTGVSPGQLDTFNANGFGGSAQVLAAAVQPDGKIVIGGSFTSVGGVARNYIARVNADGSLDAGFNPKADSIVYCVAVQPDGKILLGGFFTSLQPNGAASATTRSRIARLNPDGTLDTGFNPNANNSVFCLAPQPDGKILLGGGFTSLQPNGAASATTRNRIARLNSDGTLDASFNPNANSDIVCVHVQQDGKILLGGGFTTLQPNGAASPTTRNRVARVNADGTLDTGFDPNLNSFPYCMSAQPDGKILIAGFFTALQPNGAASPTTRNRVARVNTNGTLDAAFDPNVNGDVRSIVLQTNGKIVMGGNFSALQPNGAASATTRNQIARVHADGTLDMGFDPNAGLFVNGVAMQPDGKVLVHGNFATLQPNGAASPTARQSLARLLNESATQILTAPDANSLLWTRGGGAPEVSLVTFEQSLNGGASWTSLGAGTRVGTSGNWQLTGLSIPIGVPVSLRARGVIAGGAYNGSIGLAETVIATQFNAPEIAVEQPALSNIADGGSRSFGSVALGSNASLTFTIKNTGTGDLTGLGITIDGANAADFTVTAAPTAPVAPGSGSTTFVVRFAPAAAGSRTAALHMSSNDADENPFDIILNGAGNAPPSGGTMTLNPASPVTAGALLNVSFAGWTDPDAPLTYQVLVDNVAVAAASTSASINFTGPAATGSHTLKGIITDALGLSAEVTQSFTVITAQQSWRQTYFGTTSNSGNAADTFDFDLDGLPNLIEFAFGLNPTLASSMQLPQAQRSGGNFTVTFTQPASVSGITYGAEWSTSLAPGSWTTITDSGSGSTHTFSVPVGANSKLFLRLVVTSP